MTPDTEAGVREFLAHACDVPVADVQADPVVPGCWLVTFANGTRGLAYVGSHPLADDFEMED